MVKKQTRLSAEKDHVFNALEETHPADPDYTTAVTNLKTLHSMEPEPNTVNANTWVTAVTYVVTTGVILLFEAFGHVISSKAATISLSKPRM